MAKITLDQMMNGFSRAVKNGGGTVNIDDIVGAGPRVQAEDAAGDAPVTLDQLMNDVPAEKA